MKAGNRIELTLEKLALGGEAVARIDSGMVVFVQGGIPVIANDRNLQNARRILLLANWWNSSLLRPLRNAALRIFCRCCRGCKWQYLKYEDQLQFKQQQVVEALAHIGRSGCTRNDILGMESPLVLSEQNGVHLGEDEQGQS